MRKAFDSVGHGALWTACKRLGIPDHLVKYYSKFYLMSGTRLVRGNTLSETITSKRGIKQGDPMSVHLFNAVIDLCVQKLNRNIGYTIGDERITYMAFADDIVLFVKSKEGLSVNVELLNDVLRKAGFEANPGKCATISIGPRKGKWFSDGKPFLAVDGVEVPAVSITETYRYLGAQVGVKLEGSNPRKEITTGEHFLPKFYHQLVLLEPTSKTLCALDYQIRSAAKRWLKVKQQCPSAFLYADIKDGGLGVPSLKYKNPTLKHQRMCSHRRQRLQDKFVVRSKRLGRARNWRKNCLNH
ncbi:hypothetical protein EB796_024747 [Bugula neritina]|uniref:Reverse transcriptase domain-containing protein n=1 Tax=Bugula neritina TaxID=10212 RepID=A0A7J7IUN1_BUGNE|nr:hypothetical protein EB796_024747 [Bugula neritina]